MTIQMFNRNYVKLFILVTLTVLTSARSIDTVIAPMVTNSHVVRTPRWFE